MSIFEVLKLSPIEEKGRGSEGRKLQSSTTAIVTNLKQQRIIQMLKTETSKVEAKKATIIWVLTIFFSPYKACENWHESRCFVSMKLAKEAMKKEAMSLYKDSEIIQEADNKYFERSSREIHFGESRDESDYRREFGFCKIDPVKLEGEESGDDMPLNDKTSVIEE
ncbi:2699_t:CDS:2 [Entrophospora sp. SA101]|nr:2699_t:CDS:2 [Entrophospora sp. SA101]